MTSHNRQIIVLIRRNERRDRSTEGRPGISPDKQQRLNPTGKCFIGCAEIEKLGLVASVRVKHMSG